jgi:hypothetical protein
MRLLYVLSVVLYVVQLDTVDKMASDAGSLPCNNETLSVLAALSHVAHLVHVASRILQIYIPHSIPLQYDNSFLSL